jgi:hypothetical protein
MRNLLELTFRVDVVCVIELIYRCEKYDTYENSNLERITESYINSGVMLPEGQAGPEAPPNSKFTITFDNPGTYDYVCLFHPWMTGSVKVE